jgi:hypothetical protein
VGEHPFRAVWRTRDVTTFAESLAPDVVLHSPILTTPFRGREEAIELYEVLIAELKDVEITDELVSDSGHAFFWTAGVGGRRIEGNDLLRTNEQGLIGEAHIFIRPLVDIAAFAAAVGPPLAARRGRLQAAAVWVLSLFLKLMLAPVDILSPRLIKSR